MSTIKINELAESDINLTDLIAKSDTNGLMTKTNIEKLANYIGAIGSSGMKAAIESTSPAPTEDGLFPCAESGTYTNFGGEVVDISGQVVFISVSDTQTVFTQVVIPLNIVLSNTPTENGTDAFTTGGAKVLEDKFITDENIYGQEYTTIQQVINGIETVQESIFLPSASHSNLAAIENFIHEIKFAESTGTNILETDEWFLVDVRDEGANVVRIRIRNNINSDTGLIYFDLTGLSGIQYLEGNGHNFNFNVKLDVDNVAFTTTLGTYTTLPLDMAKIFVAPVDNSLPNGLKEILAKVTSDANQYADDKKTESIEESINFVEDNLEPIIFENSMVNGDFRSGYDFVPTSSTAPEQTVTGDVNGVNFDIDTYASGEVEVRKYGFTINPNERYAISVEYILNSIDIDNEKHSFGFNVRFGNAWFRFGKERLSTQTVGQTFTETYIRTIDASETPTTNGWMGLRFKKDDDFVGKSLNFTIKKITLILLGTSETDNKNYNTTENEIETYLKIKGYIPNQSELANESTESSRIIANDTSKLALHKFNPYYGRHLIVWGHSVVQFGGWQEMIANHYGMEFDPQLIESGGVDGYQEVAIGGTHLVPIVINNDSGGVGKNHYMKLRESFVYFDEKYTTKFGAPLHMFFFNFNDRPIGANYISGNAYNVPADLGINDTAWDFNTYGEVNLLTNPNETNLPSFGAAYRAALDFVFSVKPLADVMLITGYKTQSFLDDTSLNQMNTITELMGVEYCVPVINFYTTLWSKQRQEYFLKDEVHLDWNGKVKMATSVIRQM